LSSLTEVNHVIAPNTFKYVSFMRSTNSHVEPPLLRVIVSDKNYFTKNDIGFLIMVKNISNYNRTIESEDKMDRLVPGINAILTRELTSTYA